jgi:hypothetical protein
MIVADDVSQLFGDGLNQAADNVLDYDSCFELIQLEATWSSRLTAQASLSSRRVSAGIALMRV